MKTKRATTSVHPVGIDLGTTYSCISYLTAQGEPVPLPNTEGEMATPSVVLFDGDDVVVGTEALRNAVTAPERVVTQAKRHMGDPNKCWVFDGHVYRPGDISAFILRKLLDGAEERLGKIRHAVITVPAQFSDVQRQQTRDAALEAGLDRVDIINEPVAAALCFVLGEGMWFAELANEQTVMVFDLGGGTFDLSLVKYDKSEVRVVASGGDLNLGGLDWNEALKEFACNEFAKVSHSDPRIDLESMQALSNEVEQVKRSLSVREKASLQVQHDGKRKTYPIDRERFELLTTPLVNRTRDITLGMLKAHKMGWAHIDAVLVTGGASRMPMIREMLERISGTTQNTTLSPDQSICFGAAYYAGMLLSGQRLEKSSLDKKASARLGKFKQQSVTGRALGILVRDMEQQERVPHYLIQANTPLPCAYRQQFGTVRENQKRVHLHIIESGTATNQDHVELGDCVIEELPKDLPVGSPIEVTIRYDEQGIVHVEARDVTSGKSAKASIKRRPTAAEKPVGIEVADHHDDGVATVVEDNSASEQDKQVVTAPAPKRTQRKKPVAKKRKQPPKPPKAPVLPVDDDISFSLEDSQRLMPLCNDCGEALNTRGQCLSCKPNQAARPTRKKRRTTKRKPAAQNAESTQPMTVPPKQQQRKKPKLRKRPKQ